MADQNQGQTQGKPGDKPKATSPEDRQKAQKEVQDLRQKLQEAETRLAETGDTRQTTAEEDLKMLQDRAQSQQVRVVGKPGGPFTINGQGFGNSSGQAPWPGQVIIAGRAVPITSWRDGSIKGTLPPDLPEKGDVEVTINSGAATGKEQKIKGQWPAPRPVLNAQGQVQIKLANGQIVSGELVRGDLSAQPGAAPPYLPGAQGVQGGGPDMNPPPGSTGTMAGQTVGSAPSTATGGPATGGAAGASQPQHKTENK